MNIEKYYIYRDKYPSKQKIKDIINDIGLFQNISNIKIIILIDQRIK